MSEDKMIDQSQLAESVSDKIPYEFFDFFLVKPLDKIMVKKEVTELPNSKPVEDKDGVKAVEGAPTTEVKEVESDYQQGIVIKVPKSHTISMKNENAVCDVKIGDVIIYKTSRTTPFDLVKNSRLIRSFDITAKVNG